MLDFDTENQKPYTEQLDTMGYSSSNTIFNLGSLVLMLFVRVFQIALVLLTFICRPIMPKRCRKFHRKMFKENVFGGVLLLTFEAFLEICISITLGLLSPSDSTMSGEKLSNLLNYVFGYGFAAPIMLLSILIIVLPKKIVSKKLFNQLFGAVTENFRL